MGPRAGISNVLIAAALVLVLSIFVGTYAGGKLIGGFEQKESPIDAMATAAPGDQPAPLASLDAIWKRSQAMAIATDPGFPDPRVTPPPPPRPQPRTEAPQAAASAKATPRPTPRKTPVPDYTSPPLPIPLVTPAVDALPSVNQAEPAGSP